MVSIRLLHPLAVQILLAIKKSKKFISIYELSKLLKEPTSKLYYHIKKLSSEGILIKSNFCKKCKKAYPNPIKNCPECGRNIEGDVYYVINEDRITINKNLICLLRKDGSFEMIVEKGSPLYKFGLKILKSKNL